MTDSRVLNVFDKTITDKELIKNIIEHKSIFNFVSECLNSIPYNTDTIFINICSNNNLIDIIEVFYLNKVSRKHKYVYKFHVNKNKIISIVREYNINKIINEN
jgi:hypothetical protein